jgi:hypothetical protein
MKAKKHKQMVLSEQDKKLINKELKRMIWRLSIAPRRNDIATAFDPNLLKKRIRFVTLVRDYIDFLCDEAIKDHAENIGWVKSQWNSEAQELHEKNPKKSFFSLLAKVRRQSLKSARTLEKREAKKEAQALKRRKR